MPQNAATDDERPRAGFFASLRRAPASVERWILIAALAGATLVPLADAVGRWSGRFHVPGASAYVQQLTLWIAFVGALVATRQQKHITLSTTEFLGHGRLRRFARLVTSSLAAATIAVLAYAAYQVVAADFQRPKTLPGGVPEWTSECVMPIALGLMALGFVRAASPRLGGRVIAVFTIGAALALGLMPALAAEWAWPLAIVILAAASFGAPIFVIMGALALLLFFKDGTPVAAVSAEVYRLIASPILPAIPLLTACGYVLAEGQASRRLLRFFKAGFGWAPGGLAIIVVAVCALFTTFTGGSGVTIIAVGGLVYPMLRADGYPAGFSLGLVTAAGSLGLLFPPSLPVILYSVVATARDIPVPADSLYLAGLAPGLLLAAIVAVYGVIVGRRVTKTRQSFSWRELAAASWTAKWELLLPIAIIGLFISGSMSMVETAAFAFVYAVVTQSFFARDVHVTRALPQALVKAGALMGAVLILLAVAMGLTSYLVDAEIADLLLGWVQEHIHSRIVFLLALNALLLAVGCLMDIYSAIVVVVPLIAPIGLAFGVDPVHLGVIFLANLELGFLTPPIGVNLFISSSRFGIPLLRVYRDTFPFLLILLLGVLAITYVPDMSLGLLRLLGR
ncbi:MAG: TRAP transporter large permease subunit [Vicinamibacteria bacterium]|nr:TRAP transporter large permease subunit [Vicinamibacteria bacterium]